MLASRFFKILVGICLALPVVIQPAPAEATHSCTGFIDLRPAQDAFFAVCSSGRGWFYGAIYCYSITWVVENGEVVKKIKNYGGPYKSPTVFKSLKEATESSWVQCPSSKPWIEREVTALKPVIVKWHG